MKSHLTTLVDFLIDLERLKLITRRAYVSDFSRRESSAEHRWHLAMGLLVIAHELNVELDLPKALMMALVHDACEIDAGDTPAYGPVRNDKHEAELKCIERLSNCGLSFGPKLRELWLEYDAHQSVESRGVGVMDLLMPFIVNIATEGRNWKEQSISRSQVLHVSRHIEKTTPEIHEWMTRRIDKYVNDGWLRDA